MGDDDADLPLTDVDAAFVQQVGDGRGGEAVHAVESLLGKTGYGSDSTTSILVDYFLHAAAFASKAGFPEAQRAAFYSIMKRTLEAGVLGGETESHATREEAIRRFEALVLAHAPGGKVTPPLFAVGDAEAVIEHAYTGLFRHFELYRAVFTQPREEAARTVELVVEEPMPPQALAEAEMQA